MEELALEHLHAMRVRWCGWGLVDPRPPGLKLKASLADLFQYAFEAGDKVSTKARCNGSLCCACDAAWANLGGALSLVHVSYHVERDGNCKTFVFTSTPSH